MAPQKRTRQQAGDLSSESLPRKPPAKRIKTRTWESPPEFWDRLSKIALTHGALRELDRRTELSRTGLPRSRHSLACTTSPFKVTRALTRALTRLANDGGPDLSDLRGVGIMTYSGRNALTMNPAPLSPSARPYSRHHDLEAFLAKWRQPIGQPSFDASHLGHNQVEKVDRIQPQFRSALDRPWRSCNVFV